MLDVDNQIGYKLRVGQASFRDIIFNSRRSRGVTALVCHLSHAKAQRCGECGEAAFKFGQGRKRQTAHGWRLHGERYTFAPLRLCVSPLFVLPPRLSNAYSTCLDRSAKTLMGTGNIRTIRGPDETLGGTNACRIEPLLPGAHGP